MMGMRSGGLSRKFNTVVRISANSAFVGVGGDGRLLGSGRDGCWCGGFNGDGSF